MEATDLIGKRGKTVVIYIEIPEMMKISDCWRENVQITGVSL
jgi:hypothetical protein